MCSGRSTSISTQQRTVETILDAVGCTAATNGANTRTIDPTSSSAGNRLVPDLGDDQLGTANNYFPGFIRWLLRLDIRSSDRSDFVGRLVLLRLFHSGAEAMKKLAVLTICFIGLDFNALAGDAFNRGFEKGWKEGWRSVRGNYSFTPIYAFSSIPRVRT